MMKIIVFGAHPDDAEFGAGGLCIRASKMGYSVLIVHLSREVQGRKINGIPEAKIRVKEAKESARILGVKSKFLDYYMGECPVTLESYKLVENLLRTEKPDIVFTQWPIDTHPDHQVAGILPMRAYVWHQKFCLAFYEVYTGIQTIDFQPNRYVNISGVMEQKREAILAHKSQWPENQVAVQEKMSLYRGLEMGCEYAEAFHVLGGQVKTPFDKLLEDKIIYKDSGGGSTLTFPEWR